MNLTNRIAGIVISDTHINSSVAVSPPTVNLDDGGTYRSSRIQRALWESWNDFHAQAERITEGMTRVLFLNGDIGELDTKRRSNQLITLNKATIQRIVLDVLEPALRYADHVVVVRGTMAHTGKAGWLEEAIAADLDNAIPSGNDVFSWYQFRGVLSGVKFDVAHHGKMGSIRQTSKGAAVRLAIDTMDKYRDMGESPPDVVIRSHNHRRADSGRNYPTFAMFTPAWQMMTEFGYRIGAENSLADIGGDVFICEGGRYTWHDYRYQPKVGKVWALKI